MAFDDSSLLYHFGIAVETLATGADRLQDRLRAAFADRLTPLRVEVFPDDEELQAPSGSIQVYLSRKEACGDEGTIAATTAVLAGEDAKKIVKTVVEISYRPENLFER
jgi:hypothetical protein